MSGLFLQIGSGRVCLRDPAPDQIDPLAVLRRVGTIRRFGGEPDALTVLEHMEFTAEIAVLFARPGFLPFVRGWARRHDLHEGVIGDIVSPVGRLLDRDGELSALKARIDGALAPVFGTVLPGEYVSGVVHRADQCALALEWIHVLNRDPESWLPVVPRDLSDVGLMLARARARAGRILDAVGAGRFTGYGRGT